MRRSGVRLPMAPPSRSLQFLKSLRSGIPQILLAWFVDFQWGRSVYKCPRLFKGREFAGGNGLHCDIPQRSGFDGAGDDWNAGRIRGEPVQQSILASATDDVQLVDALAS